MVAIRSLEEVVDRALCVYATVALIDPDNNKEDIVAWLRRNGLYNRLSPREMRFVEGGSKNKKDRIFFSWMNERLHILCWALGHENKIELPNVQSSGDFSDAALNDKGSIERKLVIQSSSLRPMTDLSAADDLIAHQHWLARDRKLKKLPSPDVDIEIVQERHAAINWILCYEGRDWDDVTTDT